MASPYPPRRDGIHGGSQVIARTVDELARLHRVAVVYLRGANELPMEEALTRSCEMVDEVARPASRADPRRAVRLLAAWVRGYPMWVEAWNVPAFRLRLRKVLEEWLPDVAQFEFHTMAQYLEEVRGECSTVLVEHEPGAAAAHSRWQLSSSWRRPFLKRDARAWLAYERDRLRRFEAVVCFTEMDRREVRELAPGARVEVIAPCGLAFVPGAAGAESLNNILFAANFMHPPNVDAAVWMAKKILPRVRERHPVARLQLVGANAPSSVMGLRSGEVTVTGRVPDVLPYLEAATVVVAPLRMGGGIRIKVMDALAHGKATVATTRAVEGLGVSDGCELLIADSEAAFAVAVSRALGDRELRQRLSAKALDWAAHFNSPHRVGDAFEDLYATLGPRRKTW